MTSKPNRLIHETSPYLLQHAYNPVEWFPWGEEAFQKAIDEDKPVLVSIGYSACHWCHVMERESFENPDVAAIMNANFVNIKVDREERPDVDHIYMDAVQAISGSGGWPLNVFLTPDKKPFYGGTYYPPQRAFNRASWPEVLMAISQSYREKKEEINEQAKNLTEHLEASNAFGLTSSGTGIPGNDRMEEAFQNIMKNADRTWGGFGQAPKFPQSFTITFLLRYAFINGEKEALEQAILSLDKMCQGGIYDQVGGGFARYATDTEWLVPHFEKMLYDNALLVTALAEAYQVTGDEYYREVIKETLEFVERELMPPSGGFYSALDADSEGVEGKFYVWQAAEVKEVLGPDAGIFADFFDISESGNWEGHNIPRILKPLKEFAAERGLEVGTLQQKLEEGKKKLLERRSGRVRPQLDDKVILGWNALMNIAYSKAYAATGDRHYEEVARKNMDFLLQTFTGKDGMFHHTWKNKEAKYPAFLDDYSYLIAALVELVQVTAHYPYLDKAAEITELVIEHFSDSASPFFFFTHKGQDDILVRKKEVYDGATPSGNAVMAYNLYRLSILLDRPEWRQKAEAMLASIGEVAVKYPTSFGIWLALLFEINKGTSEIAIIGGEWKKYLEKINGVYISHKLALATETSLPGYPLLAGKAESREILIYLCKNYACRQPVNTIQEFVSLL